MGKVLVIAEKTKTAKALITGITGEQFVFKEKANMPAGCARVGYFESPNIIVACARGHLFSLYSIEEYVYGVEQAKQIKSQWSMDVLPYVPGHFKRKLADDKNDFPKKQFAVIRELVHRPDIDYIVHYGDPDNEGELLIREILEEAGNTKEVKRLFTNSLVPAVVAEAFYLELKNDRDYNNMYLEALARQQTDWLLGINLSRYLSLMAKTKFRAGRVIIPIVKYIYDRDMEIKNFVSQKSLGINVTVRDGDFERTIYTSEPKIHFEETQREECQQLLNQLSASPMVVQSVDVSRYKIKPKKFMCLTDFRSEMNDNGDGVIQKVFYNGDVVIHPDYRTAFPQFGCGNIAEFLKKISVDEKTFLSKNLYYVSLHYSTITDTESNTVHTVSETEFETMPDEPDAAFDGVLYTYWLEDIDTYQMKVCSQITGEITTFKREG